ncbi:AgmX/PglI C-terminal domain-containing protein [candidate division KSB1 bacterium]|nr:AgmX/PglI C-terminal domain-containing protein [candidate division KSB1 bacterium]
MEEKQQRNEQASTPIEVNPELPAEPESSLQTQAASPTQNQPAVEKDFQLTSLPKEFQKSIWSGLNLRFSIIFWLTFVVMSFLVYWLPQTITDEIEQNLIQRMHRRFVDTILREDAWSGVAGRTASGGRKFGKSQPAPKKDLGAMVTELLSGILKGDAEISDLSKTPKRAKPPQSGITNLEDYLPSETDFLTTEELLGEVAEKPTGQATGKPAGTVGLLGVITSGSQQNQPEYVADLIRHPDSTVGNLDGVLSRVKALKVPRVRRPTAWLDVDDVSSGLKTGRLKLEASENQAFYDSIAPLARITATPLDRNTDLDIADAQLAALNRRKARNNDNRSAAHISRVLAGHSRVIQDCYKQILKNQPGLKGKIVVSIAIDPDGRVVTAEIMESTLHNPKIEKCVLMRIERWNDFGPCELALGVKKFKIPYKFGLD